MTQERVAELEAQAKFIESGLKYADHGAYGQDLRKLEEIGKELRAMKPQPVYTAAPARQKYNVGDRYYMHIAFAFNDYHSVIATILEVKPGKLVCRVRSNFGTRVDEVQEIEPAYMEQYGRYAY